MRVFLCCIIRNREYFLVMNLLILWLLNAISILAVASFLPGVTILGFGGALVTALVLGILNALIRPLLILLTLPINILTLGLFTLIINAIIILLASAIVPQFKVDGFGTALLFSIILALANWLIHSIIRT